MKGKLRKVKAAFVGFGEVNTPREFIDGRCAKAASLLKESGEIELFETPPVSDDPAGEQATRAVSDLRKAGDFDLLILCIAGWIPTWAVMAVVEPFKHKPVLLWGLSGWQDGGRFITTADQAGTTALRHPLKEMGCKFKYLVNYMGGEPRLREVIDFAKAARAASLLKGARIGMGGYRDMRLYGTMYDGMALKSAMGVEIEHFELLEIKQFMDASDEAELAEIASGLKSRWTFTRQPKEGTVENSVRLAMALSRKVKERDYAGLSYNDVDGIKKLMGFAPAGAMTLFHELHEISSVPENDSHGAVTQLMVRLLTGQCAAYLEFYEFMEDGALMGVPDYVPGEIVDAKVTVMPNAFGDFGEGLLNVSKLKTGEVTLARLSCSGGKFTMYLKKGMAKTPRKWEETGWAPPAPQLPSLEIVFDTQAEEFIQNVMGQHYIISYGDNQGAIRELCSLLGITVI